MPDLTHLNAKGEARMVDVSSKPVQKRTAVAQGEIYLQQATIELIERDAIAKGNVFATARLAGIQAAKRTGDLIPLCHPLPLCHVEVSFKVRRETVEILCTAETNAQTGVEMEALTGASVAALTLYDMCKAVDKTMRIEGVRVVEKIKS